MHWKSYTILKNEVLILLFQFFVCNSVLEQHIRWRMSWSRNRHLGFGLVFFGEEGRRMDNLMFCKMHEQWGSAQQYLSPEKAQGKCIYNYNFLLDWNCTYLRLEEKRGTWFRKTMTVLTLTPLLFKCSAPKIFPFKIKAISNIGERLTVWSPLSKTRCGFLTRHDIKSQDHFSFFSILKATFSL